MIHNLIFDFGKVLVDYNFDHVVDTFFTDDTQCSLFKELICSQAFIDQCDKEDVPFDELIRQTQLRYPHWTHELQLFHDRYIDFVTGEVPGMRELLVQLRKESFRLYGLTNWCSVVHDVMRRYSDVFSLLDGQVISSEEHLLKPDVAIYERLLQKFSLAASECIFTDDREVNIAGAEAAGIRGIVFRDAAQYERELRKLIADQQ